MLLIFFCIDFCKTQILTITQDLIKNTDTSHPDYNDLTAAAQKIKTVADYLNEGMIIIIIELREQIIIIIIISSCLDSNEPSARRKKTILHSVNWVPSQVTCLIFFLFNYQLEVPFM